MKRIYLSIAVILVLLFHFYVPSLFSGNFQLAAEHYFGENTDYEYPAVVVPFGDGVIVAGRIALHAVGGDGFVKWFRPLHAFGAFCAAGDKEFALCERNAGDFYILNHQGEIRHHSDQYGKILKLKAFDNRSYGFQTERGIYIFSGFDDKMYFIPSQPGDLIDFEYSDHNKKVAIITLDSLVNCYVNLLAVTGEITAGKIMKDGLVFDVIMTKDRIRLVKDNGIFEYDYFLEDFSAEAEEYRSEEYGDAGTHAQNRVYSYADDGDLLCSKIEGKYYISRRGKKLFAVEKPAKKMMQLGGNLLLVRDTTDLVDPNGKVIQTIPITEEALDYIKIDSHTFAVVFANKIQFYKRK